MNSTFRKKTGLILSTLAFTLLACGDINSSWEVKGGGYIKYTINDDGPYTIELAKNDVEPPFYVNNSHHYFFFRSRIDESERGDQFSLMVNNPQTGKDLIPIARASPARSPASIARISASMSGWTDTVSRESAL